MSDKLVRINTVIRQEQQDALKALCAGMHDPEYMKAPTVAAAIRAAIDTILSLPLPEQRRRVKQAFVEAEQRPRGPKGQGGLEGWLEKLPKGGTFKVE